MSTQLAHALANARTGGTRRDSAFTLIELVTSLAISAILLVSIASAIVISSKALPGGDTAASQIVSGARAADLILSELRFALHVSEIKPKSVRFTIPDRDGDGRPEVVCYEWSGVAGAPLKRTYNASLTTNLIDSVQSLAFDYDTATTVETYPTPPIESAEEVLIAMPVAGTFKSAEVSVEASAWPGQLIKPVLPADATGWRVTSVTVHARQSGLPLEILHARLHRATAADLPASGTGSILGTQTVAEALLPVGTLAPIQISFNHAVIAPAERICVVFENLSRAGVAGVLEVCDDAGSGLLATPDEGATYTISNQHKLRMEVRGRVTRAQTKSVTRTLLTKVNISVQTGTDASSRVDTAVPMLNRPEVLAGLWEAPFSDNPTTADRNADQRVDWTALGGFNVSSLSAGLWNVDRMLLVNSPSNFNRFTAIDLIWEDTTPNGTGKGVTLGMIVDRSGLLASVIEVTLERYIKDGGHKQRLIVGSRDLLLLPVTLATYDDLPSGKLETKLYINPATSSFVIIANGQPLGELAYSRLSLTLPAVLALSPVGGETGGCIDSIRVREGGTP